MWSVEALFPQKNILERYCTVFYHCLGLMIRSSPHAAITYKEELFAVLSSLIGACIQGTVFGQVAHLIASMNGQSTAFQRQMQDIRDRMNYHKFPQYLQDRIAEYFNRQWEAHHVLVGENELGFTKFLSQPLKNEVDVFMVRLVISVWAACGALCITVHHS
jgi:hypothetical protein